MRECQATFPHAVPLPRPCDLGSGASRRQGIGLCLRRLHPIDSRKNLVLFRKTELFQFGENEGAVEAYFKSTTTPLNEFGFNAVLPLNCVLQTCSIWEVESLSTIFNGDIHQGRSLGANWRNIHYRVSPRHSSHFPAGRQAARASNDANHGVSSAGDRCACSGRRIPRQLPSGFPTGLGADGWREPGQKQGPPFRRPAHLRQ
jgi:hypothetical protein